MNLWGESALLNTLTKVIAEGKGGTARGICAVALFVGLGGHRASGKMREPDLMVRHGRKIWGYGRAYPKTPKIGHTYPFDL